jgi:hypothetical protein
VRCGEKENGRKGIEEVGRLRSYENSKYFWKKRRWREDRWGGMQEQRQTRVISVERRYRDNNNEDGT